MAGPGESSNNGAAVTLTVNTNLPNFRDTITDWDDTSEDETICTPTTSEDTSSDIVMTTPTTPTPLLFVANTVPSQGNIPKDNSKTTPTFTKQNLPEETGHKHLPAMRNLDKLSGFSTASRQSINNLNVVSFGSASFNNPEFRDPDRPTSDETERDESDDAEIDLEIIPRSEFITAAEQANIDRAIAESQGPRVDYLPSSREQHRIMTAFVEDLTTEKGYHTTEDDKFFAEILGEYEEEEEEIDYEIDSDATLEEEDSDDTLEGDDDRT